VQDVRLGWCLRDVASRNEDFDFDGAQDGRGAQ
jgi:hypothetical protein